MTVYLTLDYELMLGDNPGTPGKCLVEPMKKLTDICVKYGVKFTVFVDSAYLLRLDNLSSKHKDLLLDYQIVKQNILDLERNGHDIELHFHPQWLYASYDDKHHKWIMDFDHYKLSDLNRIEAFEYFRKAKSLLDSIIGRKTTVFRAGGYSITSFIDYISLFEQNGIRIDSSVCSRTKYISKFQEYDYTNIPDKWSYTFSKSISVEDQNGKFLEFVIAHEKASLSLIYLFRKYLYTRRFGKDIIWGDGRGVFTKFSRSERFFELAKKLFSPIYYSATIDGVMSEHLPLIYKHFWTKGVRDFVVIGHPKLQSSRSLKNLDSFIKGVIKKSQFKTLSEI